jgi:hypothetical protein
LYVVIADYREVFLYFSLSALAIGTGLGVIFELVPHYYRFVVGNADVFVRDSVLQAYAQQYFEQIFLQQKPKVKVHVNRSRLITITLDLPKQTSSSPEFELIEKGLLDLFSSCIGYQEPLFLEVFYR